MKTLPESSPVWGLPVPVVNVIVPPSLRTSPRLTERPSPVASPGLWVVLRPTGGEPPYTVFTVTADPAEGEAFTEAGSDLVEQVAMPAPIGALVEAFVAEHHVERPFIKRARERADPEALARRAGKSEDKE